MVKLERALRFVVLYVYAIYKFLRNLRHAKPNGILGSKIFMFYDPAFPGRLHSVVAFVLASGVKTERFQSDLWGPFGYTSQIDLHGLHLYGRDTWGPVNAKQIELNPDLLELAKLNPDSTILLAGVRSFLGLHVPPLHKASNFILVLK